MNADFKRLADNLNYLIDERLSVKNVLITYIHLPSSISIYPCPSAFIRGSISK
jgi:hypothetical protein